MQKNLIQAPIFHKIKLLYVETNCFIFKNSLYELILKILLLQGLDLYINVLEKCILELHKKGTIKLRTDRALFLYWTTTDKLEFTDWSQVKRMFGCGKIQIFQQRMIIASPPPRPR